MSRPLPDPGRGAADPHSPAEASNAGGPHPDPFRRGQAGPLLAQPSGGQPVGGDDGKYSRHEGTTRWAGHLSAASAR